MKCLPFFYCLLTLLPGPLRADNGLDFELGADQGVLLRLGYSRLNSLPDSGIYVKAGILGGYHLQRLTFDLVPHLRVGWQPMFAGLRYSLFDGSEPARLKYEWGVTFLSFDTKMITADFKNYAFYLAYTVEIMK